MADIRTSITEALVSLWDGFINVFPGIIAAIVILLIGYIIAAIIGSIVRKVVALSKIDQWMRKHGKKEAIGGIQISTLSGKLVKWWVFIMFLLPAASYIKLDVLSDMLTSIALWFPNLIVAIIVVIFGLFFAHLAQNFIDNRKETKKIRWLGKVAYIFVIIVFGDIALRQIGVSVFLAEGIIFIAILSVATAVAIGFGLGLKPHAQEMIGTWRKNFKK